MDMKFDIKGADLIEAALKELPIKYERRVAKSAIRAAGRVIANEAKRRVPVRTGTLKKSIRVVAGKSKRPTVFVTTSKGKGAKHDGWYAHLIEFGTRPHNVAKGGGTKLGQWAGEQGGGIPHPGSPAQPFLRPALDSKADEAIQIVAVATAKALGRLAK